LTRLSLATQLGYALLSLNSEEPQWPKCRGRKPGPPRRTKRRQRGSDTGGVSLEAGVAPHRLRTPSTKDITSRSYCCSTPGPAPS
jgi:hypothetical protein